MKNITNKLGIIFVVMLLFSVVGAYALTRTISDSSDNIDTFIRNSNGKYWSATFDNLELAVTDLDENGTLYIPPGAYDVDDTLVLKNISLIGSSIHSTIFGVFNLKKNFVRTTTETILLLSITLMLTSNIFAYTIHPGYI